MTDWIEDLEAFTAHQAARFAEVACKGDPARLAACTDAVAATCPLRADSGCPRERAALAVERAGYTEPRPQSWLVAAGVPEEIAQAALELDAAPAGAAQLAVRGHLVARRRPILLLRGDTTKLAAAAAWAMIHERTGYFMPAYALEGIKYDHDALQRIARVRLLVMHGLGKEFVDAPKPEDSRIVAVLERTLLERAMNGLDTIITTAVVDLGARYGAALVAMLQMRADQATVDAARRT